MRYLTVPEEIVLGTGPEGQEVKGSFFQWLDGTPLNDEKFGKTAAKLRMSVKIAKRFEDKNPGDVVPMDDAEWEALHDAVENPSTQYRTAVAKRFLPFMDAVHDATEEEPHKAEEVA